MELFNDLLDELTLSRGGKVEAGCFRPLIRSLQSKGPPYLPPQEWDLMPVAELCRLALLWWVAGFRKEAGRLAYWLSQVGPLFPLWCPEQQYNEQEGMHLFSLLSQIEPVTEPEPQCDLVLFRSGSMRAAFTSTGNGTSLGMIQAGSIEIRAFGPQQLPLSEPNRFGIQGKGMEGWARSFALPEVWLEMKPTWKETECQIDLRFVGLKPETPLAFAFYIKGPTCQIGNEILKPKSLRRFHGEEQQIRVGGLTIESAQRHKVQVIPLAGEGCFWDCEFLLSFEIHPLNPQIAFYIKCNN